MFTNRALIYNNLIVRFLNDGNIHDVGIIPEFLDTYDKENSAAKQFDQKYSYGGGWRPMDKWKYNPELNTIQYPQDPPYKPKAHIRFRNENIYIYESAWVCIVQPDGSFEVSRMD
ncbi:MAG: hypothetical protein IM561_09105 [Microcystis sp. M60BS1]|uniref:hypothetical protein n=1 Tax=unclassified Microcystis TaxID=2643300 RepID=UPI002579D820|nr:MULTISPECIES: hypothetical protein [unclassified Microcystis]MCA2594402.1 hypothetical protein [Microcystis sp. M38BS1]MCA6581473.1 hypothetical protein [Pseudanabaena sp. M34BS1SP1A06MG]MCA2510527.1 hypothetical protein [Microcystis sp. M60BS1]MCA2555761.1 hypothetical protein [Microcystis sp. M43BS1]MCA2603410.1 hypothetical protein [Microcystis sp. M26BS1]